MFQTGLSLASWDDVFLLSLHMREVQRSGCFRGEGGSHVKPFHQADFAQTQAKELSLD